MAIFLLAGPSFLASFPAAETSGSIQSSYVMVNNPFVKIGNSFLEITITLGNNTGGGIYSIVDKQTGVDFIKRKDAVGIGLFALQYWSNQTQSYQAMLGRNAKSMSYVYSASKAGAWLNFTWTGLSSTESGRYFDATVNVEIELPSSSTLSYWYLQIDNSDPTVIEDIVFPMILGIGQISNPSSGDYIVYPGWSGQLFENPVLNFKPNRGLGEVFYPSGSLNMQFIAYYSTQPNAGLYLSDLDIQGNFVKSFTAGENPSLWLELDAHHIPEFGPALKLTLPYAVALGVFHGDWYSASQIYRRWALNQEWTSLGNLSTRTDVPAWLMHVGIAADVLTRPWAEGSSQWDGSFSNVPEIAAVMKQYYGTTPLLFWRGWEKNFWGPVPDIFPPNQGLADFDSATNATNAAGGRTATIESSSWYWISPAALVSTGWGAVGCHLPRDRNGDPYEMNLSILGNSGSNVNWVTAIASPDSYLQSQLMNMSHEISDNGMNIFHLDGNPMAPYLNYNASVGPLGGGTWWVDGYRTIFSNLRQDAKSRNPNFTFGSEWMVEPYLPYTDASNDEVNTGLDPTGICGDGCYNASLNTYIPLWQSVYHDYHILYSTITLIDGRDMQYYLRGLALSFTWGEIPMVAMDPAGTGPPYDLQLYNSQMLSYSQKIAQARVTYAYPYLVEGEMLRPLSISNVSLITIPGATAIPYSGGNVGSFEWPGVTGSSWMGPDESIGVVLTNIGAARNVAFSLANLHLSNDSKYVAYSVRNGNFSLVSNDFSPYSKVQTALSNLDVCFLGVAKQGSRRASGAIALGGTISAVDSVRKSGYSVESVTGLLANATQAFYAGDFSAELSFIQQVNVELQKIQSSETTSTATVSTAISGTSTFVSTISQTSTIQNTSSPNSGGGIPELPFQLVAVVVFTSLVVVAYALSRSRLGRHGNL